MNYTSVKILQQNRIKQLKIDIELQKDLGNLTRCNLLQSKLKKLLPKL